MSIDREEELLTQMILISSTRAWKESNFLLARGFEDLYGQYHDFVIGPHWILKLIQRYELNKDVYSVIPLKKVFFLHQESCLQELENIGNPNRLRDTFESFIPKNPGESIFRFCERKNIIAEISRDNFYFNTLYSGEKKEKLEDIIRECPILSYYLLD